MTICNEEQLQQPRDNLTKCEEKLSDGLQHEQDIVDSAKYFVKDRIRMVLEETLTDADMEAILEMFAVDYAEWLESHVFPTGTPIREKRIHYLASTFEVSLFVQIGR
jgi:hypothetical protein